MSRLVEIVQDVDGQLSSKRVLAFSAFTAYLLTGVAAIFGHAFPDIFVSGLHTMTLGGIAAAIPERFAPPQPGRP
jgi:hypothetical protein